MKEFTLYLIAPTIAAVIAALVSARLAKLDWQQFVSLTIALAAAGFFVLYTVSKSKADAAPRPQPAKEAPRMEKTPDPDGGSGAGFVGRGGESGPGALFVGGGGHPGLRAKGAPGAAGVVGIGGPGGPGIVAHGGADGSPGVVAEGGDAPSSKGSPVQHQPNTQQLDRSPGAAQIQTGDNSPVTFNAAPPATKPISNLEDHLTSLSARLQHGRHAIDLVYRSCSDVAAYERAKKAVATWELTVEDELRAISPRLPLQFTEDRIPTSMGVNGCPVADMSLYAKWEQELKNLRDVVRKLASADHP